MRLRRTRLAASLSLSVSVVAGSVATGISETPADAATPSTWDRVAACESSGDWHIDTGNGYFGGLQFLPSTWAEFGGRRYAPRPDLATRAQQIEVARRVLASQGPGAWPVCGKRAHLTDHTGGATHAPLPAIGPVIRALPAPSRTTSHAPAAHPRPAHTSYRVRSGDTLSGIAQRLGVRGGWQALWQLNRSHVPNPNVIFVGQSLRVS